MRPDFWIHKNSMDVFYEILKSYNVHPDYTKIKYRCWNINSTGAKPHLCTHQIFKAKVYKTDLKNWRLYIDERL